MKTVENGCLPKVTILLEEPIFDFHLHGRKGKPLTSSPQKLGFYQSPVPQKPILQRSRHIFGGFDNKDQWEPMGAAGCLCVCSFLRNGQNKSRNISTKMVFLCPQLRRIPPQNPCVRDFLGRFRHHSRRTSNILEDSPMILITTKPGNHCEIGSPQRKYSRAFIRDWFR